MYRTSEVARTLLGAAQEIHAERHGSQTLTLGTHLPLQAAGERIGIRLGRSRYDDAIEELNYEGAIEWDESARYAKGKQALRHHPARLGDAAGNRLEARLPVV